MDMDKRTDHGFFGEAPPPGCRSGQREVQAAEKLVVKHGGTLGCEQRHILNDFLSIDSGQPVSGWFSLKSILPKRGSAFYTIWVIFGFSHVREPLQLLLFWSFAHGWLWKGQEGIKMGSIVEAAIYEYIGKFFLIFVVVPVGIMVLGYIICIIVEVINEIRKK